MKLYIAGPMRGIDQFNFPAFDRAAADLRRRGHEVVSPAEMDREDLPEFNEADNDLEHFDVADALRRDFRVILEQDGIVLLPGWRSSTGARAERFVAETTGRAVFKYTNPLTQVNQSTPDHDDWRIEDEPPPLNLFAHGYIRDTAGLWIDTAGQHAAPQAQTCEPGDRDLVLPRYEDYPEPAGKADDWTIWERGPVEHRVTDPETGGQKGQKDVQLSMFPVEFLREMGRVYGFGAEKYDRDNWRKGYAWHLSYDAMMRHLTAWWGGEELDPETGLSHLAHAAWHCATLFTFLTEGLGADDRVK